MSDDGNNGVFIDCERLIFSADRAALCARQCEDSVTIIRGVGVVSGIFGGSLLARKCSDRMAGVHNKVAGAVASHQYSCGWVHKNIYELVNGLSQADQQAAQEMRK